MNRPSLLRVVSPLGGSPRQAMRTASSPYQPFADYPAALVEDALGRIVASKTFRRSQRHQEFLQHVVRAALEARHEELKEVVIGLEVFGRDIADYDPRRDPIVRVEAGRIREKLARYYADEGADDAFEILIPVGGYLPQFTRRQATKPAQRNLGSLAVLPFTSLSSHADDALFCVALANQLIDTMSRVTGLRVVGRTSAFNAQAKGLDPKTLGRVLGVANLVEGSVQRAGSRLRCIAQLSRTRDGACIWSQRFEHDLADGSDLFAFQDRIGEAVLAAAVPPSVTTSGGKAALLPTLTIGTDNREARDLFERARYLEQQRSIEGYRKAIALLERAVEIDPTFASAHSHLGISHSHLAGLVAAPIRTAFRDVERYARRALELDAQDGDARTLLAQSAFRVGLDWARAEPMFREALRVAPNSTFAHITYAGGLVANGRYLESLDHGRIALDLDPLNVSLRATYASLCAYARDFETSISEFKAVIEFDAKHYFAHVMLGMAYLWSGRPDPAMRHFEISISISPDHPTGIFCKVFAHGLRGEIDVGRRLLDETIARFENANYARFNLAMAHAYLGEPGPMCEALYRAADVREVLFVTVPADPSFDPYRDEPEFIALLDRYRLPRLPPSPFASRT